MRNLTRLPATGALALAALALVAASASADIVDPVSGDPYVGDITLVNTGQDPTIETDQLTITCTGATVSGTMDGNTPATGELDLSWDGCSTGGGSTGCTVDDVEDVSVAFDESPTAPDFFIAATERVETLISCGLVLNCTAYWDPSVNPWRVPGNNRANLEGLGCPTEAEFVVQYEITVPEDGLESNN